MYFNYAEKHPPVAYLVAAYLGVKPKKVKKENDLGELMSMLGGPGKIR